jgi:segregation and condensation protein B
MPPSNLQAAIEALLFASDQPLPLSLLSETVETEPDRVTEALQALGAACVERGAGVELREIAGGWMLVTTAEQADWVGRMLRGKRRMRLSRAALETMAIIAYKQPVTKSEVEAIRGVDSSAVLATLLERNLVTIRGRSKVVGRPLLYGTTPEFLDYFGLRDLSELPRPEELKALVAAREPEQLDMMELEVVSQVASDLAASEAAGGEAPVRHEVEELDEDDDASSDEEDERDEDEDDDDDGDDYDEDGDDGDEDEDDDEAFDDEDADAPDLDDEEGAADEPQPAGRSDPERA